MKGEKKVKYCDCHTLSPAYTTAPENYKDYILGSVVRGGGGVLISSKNFSWRRVKHLDDAINHRRTDQPYM